MNRFTIVGTLNMNNVFENAFEGGTFYQFSIVENKGQDVEPVFWSVSTTLKSQIDYLKSLGNVPVVITARPQTNKTGQTGLMFEDVIVLDGQIGGVAKAQIMGSITQNSDLTVKQVGDNKVVNFTVAAKTGYDAKNKKTVFAYIRVAAWGDLAEKVAEKYATHKIIALDGFAKLNKSEYEGKKLTSVEVTMEREAFFLNMYDKKEEVAEVEEKPAKKTKKKAE